MKNKTRKFVMPLLAALPALSVVSTGVALASCSDTYGARHKVNMKDAGYTLTSSSIYEKVDYEATLTPKTGYRFDKSEFALTLYKDEACTDPLDTDSYDASCISENEARLHIDKNIVKTDLWIQLDMFSIQSGLKVVTKVSGATYEPHFDIVEKNPFAFYGVTCELTLKAKSGFAFHADTGAQDSDHQIYIILGSTLTPAWTGTPAITRISDSELKISFTLNFSDWLLYDNILVYCTDMAVGQTVKVVSEFEKVPANKIHLSKSVAWSNEDFVTTVSVDSGYAIMGSGFITYKGDDSSHIFDLELTNIPERVGGLDTKTRPEDKSSIKVYLPSDVLSRDGIEEFTIHLDIVATEELTVNPYVSRHYDAKREFPEVQTEITGLKAIPRYGYSWEWTTKLAIKGKDLQNKYRIVHAVPCFVRDNGDVEELVEGVSYSFNWSALEPTLTINPANFTSTDFDDLEIRTIVALAGNNTINSFSQFSNGTYNGLRSKPYNFLNMTKANVQLDMSTADVQFKDDRPLYIALEDYTTLIPESFAQLVIYNPGAMSIVITDGDQPAKVLTYSGDATPSASTFGITHQGSEIVIAASVVADLSEQAKFSFQIAPVVDPDLVEISTHLVRVLFFQPNNI